MNRQEALSLLGFKTTDTPSMEELNKKFRKLSAKLHPDVNKEENAEENFKKLSAAYDYLKNPPPEPSFPSYPRGPSINDVFSSFFVSKPEPILIRLPLSFKESVLGTQKKMKYQRMEPCHSCGGSGKICLPDPCKECQGKGYKEHHMNNAGSSVSLRSPCLLCGGVGHDTTKCHDCDGKGGKLVDHQIEITIPGGLMNGSKVGLSGLGHVKLHRGQAIVGDVQLIAKVTKEVGMSLSGEDVISTIDISLSDALKGIEKRVKTVLGEKQIEIPPGSKHKDQIKLSGHGVNASARSNHIFTLNVHYPKNLEKLISLLENEENNGI